MGAKGWKMGVWIRTLGSTPYLSSPASGSPSGAAGSTLRTGYPTYKLQVKTKDRAAQGPPCVPGAPAPASYLRTAPSPPRVPWAVAPASRLRAAPVPQRVPWAVAPTSRLRATPGPPRVLWAGSVDYKQLK
jgi:hypothetical protein